LSRIYTSQPKAEIQARIKKLKQILIQANVNGALLFSITGIYYYSGYGADGVIYIPIEGEPIHLVKRNVSLAERYSQIPNIQPLTRISKIFKTLKIPENHKILIEEDYLSYSFVKYLKDINGSIQFLDGSQVFREIRSIKSKYEITMLKKAAKMVDESFLYCCDVAQPDMSEIELASKLDSWLLNNGHGGYITTRAMNSALLNYSYVVSSHSTSLNIQFTPISGYGLTLKYPYGPSKQKIGKNKPFFVDTCGNWQGYISDTTRTFICGKFNKEAQDQLIALEQVKEFILKNLNSKKNLGDLFREVMELSKELKIYNNFMGTISDKSAFLGHGIGLELDELPIFYAKGPDLCVGNVLACEPKIIVIDKTVLGIEDSIVIKDTGARLLSTAANYYEI